MAAPGEAHYAMSLQQYLSEFLTGIYGIGFDPDSDDLQCRLNDKVKFSVGLAQSVLDEFRRGAACEDKAQITRAFGQRNQSLVGLGGNPNVFHSGGLQREIDALDVLEDAGLGDGNHHHARRLFLATDILYRLAQRQADKELFQRNQVGLAG